MKWIKLTKLAATTSAPFGHAYTNSNQFKKRKQNQTTEEGTIKRAMQLNGSEVWIWEGLDSRPIRWPWLNLMVITWARLLSPSRRTVEFVTSSVPCVCGCEAISRNRYCIHSLFCSVSREQVLLIHVNLPEYRPPWELGASVLHLATSPASVVEMCEQKHSSVFVWVESYDALRY